MRMAERNLDRFWALLDAHFEQKSGKAKHRIIKECLSEGGDIKRTPPWTGPTTVKPTFSLEPVGEYQPLSRMIHDKNLQITGIFDKLSVEEKAKTKTRGVAAPRPDPHHEPHDQDHEAVANREPGHVQYVDKRTYKVFKTLFHIPHSETSDLPGLIKWNDFKHAMTRVRFSVEKLLGATCQFTPCGDVGVERGIHFHEPHPDSDIPYTLARRLGRRLERAYGWRGDTFRLS
jgi:hypothetical protein